jgi:hypothetical protein
MTTQSDRIPTALSEYKMAYDRAHQNHAKALSDRFSDAGSSAEQDLRYMRAELDWVMDRAWAELKEALLS